MDDQVSGDWARVRRVGPEELVPGHVTPGMERREAMADGGIWAGTVTTQPGVFSGWHHHGDHETVAYVTEGAMRIEYGPGGAEAVVGGPGEFLRVPAHVVHREGNPAGVPNQLVVVRAGTGPVVVNVDGPDPPTPG